MQMYVEGSDVDPTRPIPAWKSRGTAFAERRMRQAGDDRGWTALSARARLAADHMQAADLNRLDLAAHHVAVAALVEPATVEPLAADNALDPPASPLLTNAPNAALLAEV